MALSLWIKDKLFSQKRVYNSIYCSSRRRLEFTRTSCSDIRFVLLKEVHFLKHDFDKRLVGPIIIFFTASLFQERYTIKAVFLMYIWTVFHCPFYQRSNCHVTWSFKGGHALLVRVLCTSESEVKLSSSWWSSDTHVHAFVVVGLWFDYCLRTSLHYQYHSKCIEPYYSPKCTMINVLWMYCKYLVY